MDKKAMDLLGGYEEAYQRGWNAGYSHSARVLEDFVRWADEWLIAKEQREAYKFGLIGEIPPASFGDRASLLNSQLVYLREQGRSVLRDADPR